MSQKESEWEERFDEVFCKDGMLELVALMKRNNLLKENIDITVTGKRSQFLSFIKELLSNREKEIAEEVEEMRRESRVKGIKTFDRAVGHIVDTWNEGYNQALDDVLSILKHSL